MMNKFSKFIFVLVILVSGFLFAKSASAATYYVDPNSVTGCAGTSQSMTQSVSSDMLTDGGLEVWINSTTLTNWTKSVSGSSSVNIDSTTVQSGTYSARFDIDGSTSNVFIYQGTTALMTAGHTYRLSYYAKGTATFGIQPGYRGSTFTVIANPTITTDWVNYSHTFTPTQNSRIEIGRQSGQGANQSFYIDSVSLVEVSTDCAWKNLSNITGLIAGDTVKLKKGEIWRETFTVPTSGAVNNPITFETYGSGNKPAITKLTDFSHGLTYTWSNSGTPDSSIYKLTGSITNPLLSPWGVLNGGHPDFNFLTNGSFETWSGAPSAPNSWTISKNGTSDIAQETVSAYTSDSGANTLKLILDGSASEVSAVQHTTLAADTTYVFRAIHKETGSAQTALRIRNLNSEEYFNFATGAWDSSESANTIKNFAHRNSYYDSWVYFKTPVGSSASYEIKLSNGSDSANQSIYLDQVIVIEKKQLNNNFLVGTSVAWNTNGFSSLRNREMGITIASLQPGEWYWEDEIMYYRMAGDESSINITHIEIAQGNWASSLNCLVFTNKTYVTLRDLDIGYCQKYIVHINSTSNNLILERVASHNGDMAFLLSASGVSDITIRNSVAYDTFEHSFYDMGSSGNRYWNNTVYKTQTDNGVNLYPGVSNVNIKNFIVSQSDVYDFSMTSAPFAQGTADHLLYDGNILSGWPTAGMSNVVSDPLFSNPLSTDFSLQNLSPAIDAGIDVGLTTDYEGNSIYGTPDIGAYEYQPPYTIASDLIDPTGSIRIYSDGKYRYTTATSSTQTVNFSVSPVGGWPSSDYSEYMNVTLDSWLTSGTKNKQWTATSSIATNTIYTIGNLAPSKYYQFKLDGVASTTAITGDTCTNGLCLSDPSGNLTFTYTGGYSTHTFALEQNTGAPTNVGISSISADSTTQLTIASQTATDADPGLHSAPYWFNETTAHLGGSFSSDWQTSTSFVDSGLSANTQYTYQVKARDNNLNESDYSDALSKYTLAPTPTNLTASSNSNSVNLSVDSFPNDTSGQSGYYFSRSGGGNSGWIQTNSWTDIGLSCGHEYTYSVKYRNGDGTETSEISTTKSTSGCGSSGSPAMWTLPIVPTNGFKMSINGGALTASNRNVLLGFNAGADIKKMAISMTGDFTDASQENYVASKQWDLCSKFGGLVKNPTCPDGTYKVYAQFYTAYGRTTGNAFASSTIVFKSSSTNSNIGVGQTPTTQTTSNIGQFTLVLKYGSNNTQVLWLQNLLKNLGFFPTNIQPNGNFGPVTKQAVQKFQCANKLVCSGNERTTGYGQVGPKTRQVLNSQNH